MFTTVDFAPRLGGKIKAESEVLFDGLTADDIGERLARRGAFVFRRLHGSDGEQTGVLPCTTPDEPYQLQ